MLYENFNSELYEIGGRIMFGPVLETGNIIEVDKKQYLVLGIYNYIIDKIRDERISDLDGVLKNVENMYIPKTSADYAVRNLYYYFLYYDSKTVREFLTRVLASDNRLLACEYSSYPDHMKPEFLYEIEIKGTRKKVGKIKEETVKLNLVKAAFTDKLFAKICTTTEVYTSVFSDVIDSKIAKEQKDFLKSYMMEQLNLMAEQYYTAKNTLSYCIADVCINKKHYLAYVGFKIDHVEVCSYCSKNAGLRRKLDLIFTVGEPKKKLNFSDVAKVERVC